VKILALFVDRNRVQAELHLPAQFRVGKLEGIDPPGFHRELGYAKRANRVPHGHRLHRDLDQPVGRRRCEQEMRQIQQRRSSLVSRLESFRSAALR